MEKIKFLPRWDHVMDIVFISSNHNKYREVKDFFSQFGYEITMKNIDLPEIQGSDTEIIKHKAEYALNYLHQTDNLCRFIVEDSSLEFDALGGLPGPYIKHFLKNLGNQGLVKMLDSFDNKNANAVCNIAYFNGTEIEYFRGVDNGIIVHERGCSNFGWDDIFQPNDFDETYGEMETTLKNKISHRAKALIMLKTVLSPLSVT
jgi:inosine triphosphate pyrophosphatase